MNRFLDLFKHDAPLPPGQFYADDRSARFSVEVARSPRLTLWAKHDAAPTTGRFLLVGVATWSGYDMKLLDALEHSVGGPDVIGVFDTAECKSDEDFESRIPGVGPVFQTPVVGLWEQGKLVAKGSGHLGQDLAFGVCGIDIARMTELLDPHRVTA